MMDFRQGHETIDSEDEDIQPKNIFTHEVGDGYTFITKLFDFEL